MTEYKIKEQDKFLKEHKSRWDKGKKDEDALKVKKTTMSKILDSLNDAPRRIEVGGAVGTGRTSAKSSAPRENDLHGGEGHAIQK